MTYEELIALPSSWSNRSDAASMAPTFVSMAEGEMGALRTRQMVTRVHLAIDAEFVPAPDDFLDQRSMTCGEFEVDYVTPERMDQIVTDDPDLTDNGDGPGYYTVIGSDFRFWPIPAATHGADLTYYSRPASLTAEQSNWIFDNFQNVYTYGVLWACAMWLKDSADIALYRGNLDRALSELQGRFADRRGRSLRADGMFLQTTRCRAFGNNSPAANAPVDIPISDFAAIFEGAENGV